jgi:hypothetical protein
MSAAEIPSLDPDALYEACPDCGGVRTRFEWLRRLWDRLCGRQAGGCLTCFDEGLVPHDCPEH